MSISRNAVRIGGARTFGPPKTKKSRRKVSIPASTVEALDKHKARLQKEKRLWTGEMLIFTRERGELPDYRGLVRHHFNPYLNKAGLRWLTSKAMRHGHISALVEEGKVSVRAISVRAGHSTSTMTLGVYSHVRDEERAKGAEIVGGWRGAIPRA